jgi:hypothetical protein
MPTNNQDKWEGRFDKEFPACICHNNWPPHFNEDNGKVNRDWLKSFIRQEIRQAKEEAYSKGFEAGCIQGEKGDVY